MRERGESEPALPVCLSAVLASTLLALVNRRPREGRKNWRKRKSERASHQRIRSVSGNPVLVLGRSLAASSSAAKITRSPFFELAFSFLLSSLCFLTFLINCQVTFAFARPNGVTHHLLHCLEISSRRVAKNQSEKIRRSEHYLHHQHQQQLHPARR